MPRPPALVAALLLLLPGAAVAAPADGLLRLVPPESTFCVVLQDLRTHVRAVSGSPFGQWFADSVVGGRFRDGPDADKVKQAAKFFQDTVGVSAEELLDDVFGDAVVFAYQSGPAGRPADEAGLILIRPRKPDVLARLVGRLNDLQRTATGEVNAVREAAHRGQSYTVREKAAGSPEYYLIRDGVFAFTGQERALTALIDRAVDGSGESVVEAGLRKLGAADKAVCVWLNPRGLDADLRTKAAATDDPNERAFLSQFLKLWAATDGLAATLHPDRGLELGVSAAVRRTDVPPELAAVLFPPAGGSAALAAAPADAMLAIGGRVAVPKLLDAVGSFLPGDGQKALRAAIDDGLGPVVGRDKLPAVARGFGPDWAAWVAPPATGWVPRAATVVRLADDDTSATVARALDLGFQLVRVAYNQAHPDQIDGREEQQDGVTVRYLANDAGFPAGFRPCFAVKGGYLIVATAPAVVAGFAPPHGDARQGPPARLSLRGVREYVTRHRDEIAKATGGPKAEATADGLAKLAAVLEAIDRAELRYDAGDGRVSLTLRVELAKPLR
jgi:hypothetical protein